MMQFEEFSQFIQQQDKCPSELPKALQALWYAQKGNWNQAHEIVQNAGDADSAWVHAYLHREEGDLSNARYWYRRSSKEESQVSLSQEWEEIVRALLLKLR